MGLHSGLAKKIAFFYSKKLPWTCQTGVFQSSTRSCFSTSIFKYACIQFIFSGGDAPFIMDCMQISWNKPPISPFWVLFSSQFLNRCALPKSSINNDAHNRAFCTSTRLQPISEYPWLHTIHFYIPCQASSYILAIHSLYNSKQLSSESICCWFGFVARLSRPQSHTPCDNFYNNILH